MELYKITNKLSYLLITFVFCFISSVPVSAQNMGKSLSWNLPYVVHSYMMKDVHQQFLDRKIELEKAFQSKERVLKYGKERKARYLEILGKFPEKTALNSKVTGTINQDGFRVEKIVFESIPGRYVTANLYIPDGKGKFPVTISLQGHDIAGKRPDPAAVLLARNGIATLAVDPIGQGERIQFLDDQGKSMTRGATTEHTLLNAGSNVVGTSLAAQQCWDNHRAIDYLLTRLDIDADKIGVWGSSGGGTETTYLMGMDDRIKAAAICSYFSERERTLELLGPSDGCQHVPYEGQQQIELSDFALMIAPKPVLILTGKYDFVDLWGAKQGYKELARAYSVLGAPESAEHLIVETGHGLGKEKRNKLVAFFKKWLKDDETPIIDNEQFSISLEESNCTPTGQVLTSYKDAVSIPAANLKQSNDLAKVRAEFTGQDESVVRLKVEELLGFSVSDQPVIPKLNLQRSQQGYDEYRYEIIRNGEIPIPCVVIVPNQLKPDLPMTLVLNEKGKEDYLAESGTIKTFVDKGGILIAADLRGFGETEDPAIYNDPKYFNKEYRIAMTAMHAGRPLMGQRIMDIFTILDFIEKDDKLKTHKVNIMANGIYGPAVVHAAYLDNRINETEIKGSITSFTDFLTKPMQHNMYSNVLYGVLNYYDLDDLVRLSDRAIHFSD
jgi:dienelactone hydrolase